ncbi:histidinol phosphate phosphatase domain-containing protein [candidate division KSB1 bacterium]
MIDLHSHTILSDGILLASEQARRAEEQGYQAIALTDHVDAGNIEHVVKCLVSSCRDINANWKIKAVPGVELTHVPLESIAELATKARSIGAVIVLVHGETPVEPVIHGTNLWAVKADIDILAHPGLIDAEVVKIAAERGIYLELTTRRGHSLTNGHVARMAKAHGAKLVINTDSHQPGDLMTEELRRLTGLGAGLGLDEFDRAINNSRILLNRINQYQEGESK